MKKVRIIGSGFSGLTLAYLLLKKGVKVEIHEKADISGGLLGSYRVQEHLIEKAANALMANKEIELMLEDIGVKILSSKSESKKRYIFCKGELRRLPLSFIEIVRTLFGILGFILFKKWLSPSKGQSLSHWSSKVLGAGFSSKMLAPALQGIYGIGLARMSASLFIGSILASKGNPKGVYRGSISAAGGMGEIIEKLLLKIKALGGEVHYNSELQNLETDDLFVMATSLDEMKKALSKYDPEVLPLNTVALTSVTIICKKSVPLDGFGILFPKGERVNALGVLLNKNIFENRSEIGHTQTWIFGGDKLDISHLSDSEIEKEVSFNIKEVFNIDHFEKILIHRYPNALPAYDTVLENKLKNGFKIPSNIFLTGNYLGGIGLTKIYNYNIKLAEKIKSELDHV